MTRGAMTEGHNEPMCEKEEQISHFMARVRIAEKPVYIFSEMICNHPRAFREAPAAYATESSNLSAESSILSLEGSEVSLGRQLQELEQRQKDLEETLKAQLTRTESILHLLQEAGADNSQICIEVCTVLEAFVSSADDVHYERDSACASLGEAESHLETSCLAPHAVQESLERQISISALLHLRLEASMRTTSQYFLLIVAPVINVVLEAILIHLVSHLSDTSEALMQDSRQLLSHCV